MIRYRREEKPSRWNNQKHQKNNLCLRGHSVGSTRAKASNTITMTAKTHTELSDQQSVSSHHGELPPSPAYSAVAPFAGIRYGASHNPGGNLNTRQPGTFRSGNRQADGGTAPSARPPPALSGKTR